MADAPAEPLLHVPLNDRHIALNGRMVPFAGYCLPVQYPTGIITEHKWTRDSAGLFDVSHMGPSVLTLAAPTGDAEADHRAVAALIEPLVTGDIAGLRPGQLRYTLLMNADGGIADDLMVGRSPLHSGSLYIIVNAATKGADFARIAAAALGKAVLHRADDGALLALQGPKAVDVLSSLLPGVEALGFMSYLRFEWQGAALVVSRSGYTGEYGYEMLVPAASAAAFWDALLADERVKPIGLGARDSLRLEAGLPLYGHDLDPTVSPVEAGLTFTLSKRRRETGDIAGATRLSAELANGPQRLRVGLFVEGAPAREGAEITTPEGAVIGRVTSGGFSPSLSRAIALGFVPPAHAAPGTRLAVLVRGRSQSAEITPLPFVPHRYVRKPAS